MATVFQFPYRTVAEVSLRALVKNLHTLRSIGEREIIPVVKADAYGHGLVPISRALVNRGSVQMLGVATLDEALELREELPRGVSILVLSSFFPHQVDAYIKHRLTPQVHSLVHLKALLGRKTLPEFHLKVDTGMHRLGIPESQFPDMIEILKRLPEKVAGLSSHFAESEALLTEFTREQMGVFEGILKELRAQKLLLTDARIHSGNSGALLQPSALKFTNAVRPGLALYGLSPNENLSKSSELIPCLEWKARVLTTKELKAGDWVGYGRTYQAKKKEKIAILPVGYADGYPRLLSNRGYVLLGGKKAPLRGRVSMDMIAVDITGNPNVKEGSIALLIGEDARSKVTAWDLAQGAETIPYEILCGLSPRVPRLYLD